MWVSYSDDNGATWTPQQAFDAGIGHDTSTPFVGFTIDSQGNPYFGLAVNLSSNPATCSAESTAGTVQSDPSCEYDMYVVWSSNGGATWDGGGGPGPGQRGRGVPGQPGQARRGTHFFPAITAGDPGQVDVAYLRTTEILPTDPFGKADPGGCAGPGPANGNPTTYPPTCSWNLYAGQSLNLTSGRRRARRGRRPRSPRRRCTSATSATWASSAWRPRSNRNLLDFIMEDIDPAGCAHIAYADDNTVNKLRAANQTGGPCLIAKH